VAHQLLDNQAHRPTQHKWANAREQNARIGRERAASVAAAAGPQPLLGRLARRPVAAQPVLAAALDAAVAHAGEVPAAAAAAQLGAVAARAATRRARAPRARALGW
jgi:hypothetical protein